MSVRPLRAVWCALAVVIMGACQMFSGLYELMPDRPVDAGPTLELSGVMKPDAGRRRDADANGGASGSVVVAANGGNDGQDKQAAGQGGSGESGPSRAGAAAEPASDPEPRPLSTALIPAQATPFRAPAYPLFMHDPYFGAWSFTDTLSGAWPKHWSGTTLGIFSMIRVDNHAYRLMGADMTTTDSLPLSNVWVLPTRTIYRYSGDAIEVDIVFESPLLPADLAVLSRPVSYVTWTVRSTDGQRHAVSVYVDSSAELAVSQPSEAVTWDAVDVAGHVVHRIGNADQTRVLSQPGDHIDWGYLYHAVKSEAGVDQMVQSDFTARSAFVAIGALSGAEDANKPRAAEDMWPVIATTFDLGRVGSDDTSRTLMLAYDDTYGVEYMHSKLQSYWHHARRDMTDLIQTASQQYTEVDKQCRGFDAQLIEDLQRVGGDALREIGTLAYRQALAAHKVVLGPDGLPWAFSRDNDSVGLIAAVDTLYSAAPLFLLTSPELLQALLEPLLSYANSPRWKFEFAPHDLGRYPLANGQVFGSGEASEEDQMPIEASASLLIVVSALTHTTQDLTFAQRYLPLLQKWARYLETKGFDPASQLTADDPMSKQAHGVNLAAKTSLALAGYAALCERAKMNDDATKYRELVKNQVAQWTKQAEDGDHLRMAFDQPGTWSLKYNLAMDRVLETDVFAPAIVARELAFYRAHQGNYGVALDSRSTQARLPWVVWASALTRERADLDALLLPVRKFLNETTERLPMGDRYQNDLGKLIATSARAPASVGGVFLPLLYDAQIRNRWLRQAKVNAQP